MYQQLLYVTDPLKVLLLSVLEVSCNFAQSLCSFVQGGLWPKGLLDCGLLTWKEDALDCAAYSDLLAHADVDRPVELNLFALSGAACCWASQAILQVAAAARRQVRSLAYCESV